MPRTVPGGGSCHLCPTRACHYKDIERYENISERMWRWGDPKNQTVSTHDSCKNKKSYCIRVMGLGDFSPCFHLKLCLNENSNPKNKDKHVKRFYKKQAPMQCISEGEVTRFGLVMLSLDAVSEHIIIS